MANEAHKEPTMEEILASIRKIISDDDTTAVSAEPAAEVAEVAEDIADENVEELTFESVEDEMEQSMFEESAIEDVFEAPEPVDMADEAEANVAPEPVDVVAGYAEPEEIVADEVEPEAAEEVAETVAEVEPEVETESVEAAEEDISFEAMLGAVNKVAEDFEAVSGDIESEVETEVVETLTAEPENVVETMEPEMSAVPNTQGSRLTDESTAGAAAGSLGKLLSTIELGSENTIDGLVRELLKPMIKEWLDANLATIVEQKVEAEVQRIASMAR